MENHIKWIHQQKVKKFAVITEYWENLLQCQYSAQTRNDTTAWQATGKGCKWEVGEVQQSEITLMWLQACSPLTCHQWDQNLFPSLLGHSGLQPAVNCCHRLDSGWAAAGEHTTWVCHQLGLGQTCLHKKTSRALIKLIYWCQRLHSQWHYSLLSLTQRDSHYSKKPTRLFHNQTRGKINWRSNSPTAELTWEKHTRPYIKREKYSLNLIFLPAGLIWYKMKSLPRMSGF